ncbi:hypothetical protein E1A91_D10G153600v1 [Gossypium mustelinum]|uniref:AP2/ERF domain-containing protein n=1 Tax=Gossypium mustelinum TaxID=34275 RepID=A0A5D2T8Y6_GOSMU|nr:hypothetical protein E1A91_D10G153600v1 [Gossypium mustelinum]
MRKKFRETRHPVYRGVCWRNPRKWVSEVREPNNKSRIWLGTFPTEEMVVLAHHVATIALRGRSACSNFVDSAWNLPVPAFSNPKDIQKTTAKRGENIEMEKGFYLDEEELFGTQRFWANMAASMLMSPRSGHDGKWV